MSLGAEVRELRGLRQSAGDQLCPPQRCVAWASGCFKLHYDMQQSLRTTVEDREPGSNRERQTGEQHEVTWGVA